MKRIGILVALIVTLFAAPAMASSVVARIDLSSQRMKVYVDGKQRYSWPVSTARRGYSTPVGTFRPQRLERMWYSRKYDMSPMPHSIFFRGGYAIHGTYATGALGRPASHGCVRLAPGNAAQLFAMVQREGANISITGSAPGRVYASTKKKYGKHYARAGHKKYKHYAASRHHKRWSHVAGRYRARAPLAYAPSRARSYGGTVRSFQLDPAGRY